MICTTHFDMQADMFFQSIVEEHKISLSII